MPSVLADQHASQPRVNESGSPGGAALEAAVGSGIDKSALTISGDEALWWKNAGVDPINIAHKLWQATRLQRAARLKPSGLGSEAAVLVAQTAANFADAGSDAAAPSPALPTEGQ
jgi:hypothetical protein